MTDPEIAWLAGLFDGEGNIGLNAKLSQRCSGVRIQITNTCREMLDHVLLRTGVGYIATRSRENPKWKTTYDWITTGGNAVEILRLMRPWLIEKRDRADTAIRINPPQISERK